MTLRIVVLLALAGVFAPSLGSAIAAESIAAESKSSSVAALHSLSAGALQSLSAGALRAAVRQTLRETARSDDPEASAQRLLEAYRALDADTKLVREDRLQMQQIVRGRLKKLAAQIRQLPNQQGAKAAGPRDADAPDSQGFEQFLSALVDRSMKPAGLPPVVLAQQRGNVNVPFGPAVAGRGGLPAAAPRDYGQELVELIEATIAPSTWESNGGTGSIRYFSPLRVIVVRQTGEVHEQLGDLLPQLRD